MGKASKKRRFSFGRPKAAIALLIIILVIGTVLIFSKLNPRKNNNTIKIDKTPAIQAEEENALHWQDNIPGHGQVFAQAPVNVAIRFNSYLDKGSSISIKGGDKEYAIGESIIDANKLIMRREMDPQSPDGTYNVFYKACWTEGSCSDGKFHFSIDRSKVKNFTDLRGRSEVTINLLNIAFDQKDVLLSKGTKVTWINQEDIAHTISSYPHDGGHYYFLAQNSKNLAKGDSFSLTFAKSGVYPYHCSPHEDIMTGVIIVE